LEQGIVYWITGLSGAGKTTIGSLLYKKLRARKDNVVLLDGDVVRRAFGNDLGYTREDRHEMAMRYSRICRMLSEQGIDVVCCTISMFDDVRAWNRENIAEYREVYLRVSREVLAQRSYDRKFLVIDRKTQEITMEPVFRMALETDRKLMAFGLELSEDKTRILPFGRYRKTEKVFDFLGFTFYNTLSRNGKYRVGIRTCAKKLRAKVQAAKLWLRNRLVKPVNETMKTLSRALLGHNAYYGINGNLKAVQTFYYIVGRMTHKMLNRRSQKAKVTWEKFARIWKFHIKEPRVLVNIWY